MLKNKMKREKKYWANDTLWFITTLKQYNNMKKSMNNFAQNEKCNGKNECNNYKRWWSYNSKKFTLSINRIMSSKRKSSIQESKKKRLPFKKSKK